MEEQDNEEIQNEVDNDEIEEETDDDEMEDEDYPWLKTFEAKREVEASQSQIS